MGQPLVRASPKQAEYGQKHYHLHFEIILFFEVVFIYEVIFIFEVDFIFEVIFILKVVLIFEVIFITLITSSLMGGGGGLCQKMTLWWQMTGDGREGG